MEIVKCLVENEIKSDIDYLNDISGKEKEYWTKYILELKGILKNIADLVANDENYKALVGLEELDEYLN